MVYLYIFFCILLILLIILLLPIHVIILYEESLIIKLRLLFFTYTIFSGENSESKENIEESNKSVSDNAKLDKVSPKSILRKKGFKGFVEFASDILKLGVSILRKILKRTTIKELELEVKVGCEDAASTAVRFGQICTVIYPLISILTSRNIPKKYHIDVSPDYKNESCSVKFKLRIYARLFYIIYTVIIFSRRYVKISEV